MLFLMFGCLFAYYLGSACKCPVDMVTYVLAPDEFYHTRFSVRGQFGTN